MKQLFFMILSCTLILCSTISLLQVNSFNEIIGSVIAMILSIILFIVVILDTDYTPKL